MKIIITVKKGKNMGGSSLKKVQQTLQKNYKPLRKYYDPFYGQTTILADIESHKKYCKTQKILFPTKHLSEYISNRMVIQHQVLVQIKQIFKVPIDLCSGNEMYVFILEYAATTLYQEIIARCSADRSWDIQEILKIMFQMVQIVKILSRVQARKILLSNSSVLYFGPGKIKGIQSIFCNKLDTSDVDFPVIQTENQENRQYYISPESFQYLCRKEKQRAKEVSLQQSSIIFTIALLADLSELYNKEKNEFEYEKLREAEKNVEQIYGDGVQRLISSMLELQPHKRSSITDIEDYLKYLAKCNGLILQECTELMGSCRL